MNPSKPPPLPPPAWAGAWLAVLPLAGILGFVWLRLGWATPTCAFHRWTHWPCPSCGVTRGLQALFRGDLVAAWGWNPLAVLLPVLAVVFWGYCLGVQCGWFAPLQPASWSPQSKRLLRVGFFAGLGLFWLWRLVA